MPLNARSATRKDTTSPLNVSLQYRHFAFIAAVIAKMPDHAASLRAQKVSVANSFADACQATNPNFSRARFLAACALDWDDPDYDDDGNLRAGIDH